MDAGVPIKAAVGGAAMGLITEPDGKFVVLTDILGKEDAFGDMDFKVTGTREGVTALQMDIKVKGISEAIIRQGLEKAHAARMAILDKMDAVMPTSRTEMSNFAPRIITIKINPEKIRDIIGKGGSVIRKIQEETGTEINVEDDGTVQIAAMSGENSRKAVHVDRVAHSRGRSRRAVPGQGHPDHGLRLLRRDPARQGRPDPDRRAGRLPRAHSRGRGVGRRRGHGRGDEIDRQGRINLSRKAAMQRHLAKHRGVSHRDYHSAYAGRPAGDGRPPRFRWAFLIAGRLAGRRAGSLVYSTGAL